MPELSQQAIEAEQKLFDILGGQIKNLDASNWPQRTRTLYQPSEDEVKFNDSMAQALHVKLGVPRSLVLSPSQVDSVAKELKLSDSAKEYLHEVAKEGPIDEGLLKVISIEKPQLANFPFDQLPPAQKFSPTDARDFIKFVAAPDPLQAHSSLSKRSVVGHLIRSVEQDKDAFYNENGWYPDEDQLKEYRQKTNSNTLINLQNELRKRYGFTPEDLKKMGRGDVLGRIEPILQKIYPNKDRYQLSNIAKSYEGLNDLSSQPLGFMSPKFKERAFGGNRENVLGHDELSNSNFRRALYGALPKENTEVYRKKLQEDKAFEELRKAGLDPDSPDFYTQYGKNYSPRELATILENGPTKKGLEGDIQLVTALEQARSEHEKRTGERVFFPPVYETTREDPYRYPGLYTAPTSEQTKDAWDRALETADKIEKQRILEQNRLATLIKSMKNDPELAAHLKPSLDIVSRIPDELKVLQNKYFNEDLESSPVYQKAMERNRRLYAEAQREIDERTKNETIPAIRGRYMTHGPGYFQSPAYKNALREAEKDRQQRLDALKLRFEQQGHEQGLQGIMSTYPLEQNNVLAQHDAARQGMALNQELWKANRARRAEEETLEQNRSQRDILSRLAEEQKLGELGHAKTSEQNRQLAADMMKFRQEGARQKVEDTGRLLEIERGAPAAVPYQAAAWPMPPQVAPSGTGALATTIPAMYAATQPPPPQQPVIINMGQGGPQRFAAGGVVNRPVYDEMLAQQMAAIQNFIEQKNRHQGMPVPSVDPAASTMGSMASHMGKALGQARMGPSNMLGAWAEGMGTHPQHQNDYLEKEYFQSLKNVELEKILSDLRKDVTTGQREREHNLSTEELKGRELEETGRHHRASEGISSRQADELSRYHDILIEDKKEERERKSKELTPQKMKLIDEHKRIGTQASKIISEASFLSSIAPYLNTGGNMSKYLSPYNLGALSFDNSGSGMDFFNNRNEILVKNINDLSGTSERTKAALDLAVRSKMGVDKTPITNVANGKTQVVTGSSILANSIESQLRDGLSIDETIDDLEEKYKNDLKNLNSNYELFFSTRDYDEKEKKEMISNGIQELNSAYDKVLTRLENKKKERR